MATVSQVEAGLPAIATLINENRAILAKAKGNAAGVSEALAAIQTNFADVVATVQAYGATNDYEKATKAKFVKMVAEFNDLKAIADAVAAINV